LKNRVNKNEAGLEISKTSDPASFIGLPEFESGTPSPPDLYANQLRYSPKRVGKKSPIRLFTIAKKIEAVNSCSSCAVHVRSAQSRLVSRGTCNEREARSSPRHLQRARSAKFPAQTTGLLPGVQPIFYVTRHFLENMVFR